MLECRWAKPNPPKSWQCEGGAMLVRLDWKSYDVLKRRKSLYGVLWIEVFG